MNPIKLSVTIITFNEENNIKRCLESIADVADEIVVLDSFSTDNTSRICAQYNTKFIQHKFEGHVEQNNEALSHVTNDYVLSLDADEVLSAQLKSSIQKVMQDARFSAYSFNRLTYYRHLPVKTCGWYPDTKIRLWNAKKGKWAGMNPHCKVIMEKSATVCHLDGDLLHYSFTDFGDYVNRMKYDLIAAQAYYESGEKINIFKLLLSPLWRFFRSYFIKYGFLEGIKGLMISLVSSFSVFVKYYAYYELKALRNRPTVTLTIATYNQPEVLEVVLKSVLDQTILPNQIIIADDGSGVATKSLIERMKQYLPNLIHCWHEDRGFRLSEIRNKAIAMASGDVILQIDGDVILDSRFVSDHLSAIQKGYYTQGSRVLLGEEVSKRVLSNKKFKFSFFQTGITNRLNSLHLLSLGKIFSRGKTKLKGIRGCNMAFWTKDLTDVNGYNQDISGWGKEDTELVARLFNNGIKRKNLKFGAIQYHIYHRQNSRENLAPNIKIVEEAILQKKTFCDNGIVMENKT